MKEVTEERPRRVPRVEARLRRSIGRQVWKGKCVKSKVKRKPQRNPQPWHLRAHARVCREGSARKCQQPLRSASMVREGTGGGGTGA